jgi:hypothetical protein
MVAGLQTTGSPRRDADLAKTMANLQVASETLRVKNARVAKGLGRGRKGGGRGPNKGTITVTIRASKRQEGPSIALIFYKLLSSSALLRQRSTFHLDDKSPTWTSDPLAQLLTTDQTTR